MVPTIYIAGPYMSPKGHNFLGYHDIERNITKAREVAAWLVDLGVYFFCPHLNSAHFEVICPGASPDYWYELDLAILRRACDAMVLIEGWEKSIGAQRERKVAHNLGIPVFDLTTVSGRSALGGFVISWREAL